VVAGHGMAQSAAHEDGAGSRVASLGSHFDVLVDRPLPELSTPYAGAYVAIDRELPTASLFALICNPEVAPRLEVLEAQHGMRLDAMLTPLDWDVVDWPVSARRCFAIAYDRPTGGPVMPGYGGMGEPALVTPIDRPRGPLGDSDLINDILPPLTASLQQFLSVGATHRAIRATNIFYRDLGRRRATLGDCCAAPAALLQPLVYETIEGGLANPWGRGEGTPSDDLYALGVTIVFLSLGRNPVGDLTDEQLITDKINRGSYAAIVRNERLSTAIGELVRGLLADDAKERWTIQDVDAWLRGRHASVKQPSLAKRATRPFEFDGEAYWSARSLAHAFIRKPAAAAQVVEAPELEMWIQRSLGEPERIKTLAAAVSEGHDAAGPAAPERLVARVAIALDPAAPVR
jgi:eukaryotic-like serine/threonine-protein kinase